MRAGRPATLDRARRLLRLRVDPGQQQRHVDEEITVGLYTVVCHLFQNASDLSRPLFCFLLGRQSN